MTSYHDQKGVGLIEVMVAVLLLSIAVLGFSALQMRAINATDESIVRTKSLTLIRSLSEIMRAYPNAYVTGSGISFTSAISATSTQEVPAEDPEAAATILNAQPTIQAVMSSSANSITVDGKTIDNSTSANGCLSTTTTQNCNINQLAARDALMFEKQALDEDITINVVTCPGTNETTQVIQTQMCVIAAWNDTKAILSASDSEACANEQGIYKASSHCLISEAY